MDTQPPHPFRFESAAGLSVQVNTNGSIRRIDHGDIILNLFPGNEIEGGPANIYLRRHGSEIEFIPLLGPRSPATVRLNENGFATYGEWRDIRFEISLVLAQSVSAWLWHITLENTGTSSTTVGLIYAQDVALSHYAAVRMNEYYVSQYVDHTPLHHARCGVVVASRQNLPMNGRHPWLLIGSLCRGVSFATDALQVHGLATRAGAAPEALQAADLPGRRLQHEHSMAAIQDEQVQLDPGTVVRRGFFGWFEPDHPAASSTADLTFVDRALALPEAKKASERIRLPKREGASATLFSGRPALTSLDLDDAEIAAFFGENRRNVEQAKGRLLSFFTGTAQHVVLKAKELEVLRPHGHIMRSGDRLVPDEASLTSTAWMSGVFHSLVTQGHVGINRLLSTTHSYLSLFRSHGQRVFVELEDGHHLLDVPSAYEMTPSGCRWIYKHRGGMIQVCAWAPIDRHELNLSIEILAGPPCRFLLSHHIAINGDDGADAVPAGFARDRDGIVIRPIPDSDVGRRFPQGFFRIDVRPESAIERVGGDEILFLDGQTRSQPFLVVVTAPAKSVSFRITGHLIPDAMSDRLLKRGRDEGKNFEGRRPEPLMLSVSKHERPVSRQSAEPGLEYADDALKASDFWRRMAGPLALHPGNEQSAAAVQRIQEIAPWFAHNALIHYLAPRGLEQYSGGGWGTRDVCQGPVELLLALGRYKPMRDLLIRVFKAQNPDGDWPQWFMFFERERDIRAADSHGDIVFWPLLALARYLLASDDASLLDETVPFFHKDGYDHAERATIWQRVERALDVIRKRMIPGTHFAAYGNGDWNDSLQPVDPSMCERLCSAWTVTLHYQTLNTMAQALRHIGHTQQAKEFEERAKRIKEDFERLLMVDGTIAGYAYFHADGRMDYLLHPRDHSTGVHFSLLPMLHAIIDEMLAPDLAAAHVACIKQHLLGADGARLFDRPFPYRGGPQLYFQRAESSSFFGREIGVMYTHAHLRYAEAMARYGEADAFFLALRQAIPIALDSVVRGAMRRQANCYYSSSDAAFADRYEALADYEKVKTGDVPFEGGWRVYSSGPGVALRLIHECLLGIRKARSFLVIDPVIPKVLDGLRADVGLAGKPVTVVYRVAKFGFGPSALTLNGDPLPFEREPNSYRVGGAKVPMALLTNRLHDGKNTLEVDLA